MVWTVDIGMCIAGRGEMLGSLEERDRIELVLTSALSSYEIADLE